LPENIHPSVHNRAEQMRQTFAAGQPFPHVVIEHFLNDDFCRELMAQFPAFDAAHALNERGEAGRKSAIPDLAQLGPAFARFDRMLREPEFLEWMSRITGIPNLLYDPEYVGGGTHENLDGQELDSHVDFNYHPSRRWHRRLNLIIFLNPEWEQSWGGCLELLRDPWTPDGARAMELVVPVANRAVVFETNEHSWHGFRRIQLPPEKAGVSRRSIAVYFYTRERPAAETASAHGTFYVQRPLGEHIQAGYTLREEDVEEIQTLLERRDTQTKFLYERELEFTALISGLTQSRSFRLGHMLTWPARAARQLWRARRRP
jgi:Rps23 Pro-64 3,4-dihydroxylase Tpa1-like proline 4-hydroxylase